MHGSGEQLDEAIAAIPFYFSKRLILGRGAALVKCGINFNILKVK